MADCLRDERQAGKVDHSLRELVAQRVFSIACGYPTPTMRPAWPPIRFTSCYWTRSGRGPRSGFAAYAVALENAIGAKELYRLGEALAAA